MYRDQDGEANPGYKHGHARGKGPATRTYRSWEAMTQRCRNPNHTAYRRYGGSGVEICADWADFMNFLADMGERPEGKSLDRIDNSKGYNKANCRWATRTEQARNHKGCKLTEVEAGQIRWLVGDGGYAQNQVAQAFSVSRALVGLVCTGKIWKEQLCFN